MTTWKTEEMLADNGKFAKLRQYLTSGTWNLDPCNQKTPVSNALCVIGYFRIVLFFCSCTIRNYPIGKVVLLGTRIVVPSKHSTRVLALPREGHPENVSMEQKLPSNALWPSIDKDVEIFCKTCFCCHLVGNSVHSLPRDLL